MISPVKRNLILFTLLCICLVIARIIKTDQPSFIFMLWNLFLAFVPFCMSAFLMQKQHQPASKLKLILLMPLWLLFLPNAPYMITDLFHLHHRTYLPLWFDLFLILSFAVTGMYLFFLSLFDMMKIVKQYFPVLYKPVFLVGLFVAVSYGVYIGRFLRLNSWDVLHPLYVLKTCALPLFHLSKLKDACAFTLVFSAFLLLLFLVINPLSYTSARTQKLNNKN